jgi:hypothetical protein
VVRNQRLPSAETCFYILALAASIFGRDIRTFLSIPPQKLGIWVLKARLQSAARTLEELSRCNQNAYFLTLHIWGEILLILMILIPFIFVVGMHTAVILRAITTHKEFPLLGFRAFAVIIAYGLIASGFPLFRLSFFITQLRNLSEYEPRLSDKVLRLQSQLEKAGVMPTEGA